MNELELFNYESEPYAAWRAEHEKHDGKEFHVKCPLPDDFLKHREQLQPIMLEDMERAAHFFCEQHAKVLVGRVYKRIWQEIDEQVYALGLGIAGYKSEA